MIMVAGRKSGNGNESGICGCRCGCLLRLIGYNKWLPLAVSARRSKARGAEEHFALQTPPHCFRSIRSIQNEISHSKRVHENFVSFFMFLIRFFPYFKLNFFQILKK